MVVNTHIGEQGIVQTQGKYNASTQQQTSAMFNSLMAVSKWDHMNDLGTLSALVNLYNATDKLCNAFCVKSARTLLKVASNDVWIRSAA